MGGWLSILLAACAAQADFVPAEAEPTAVATLPSAPERVLAELERRSISGEELDFAAVQALGLEGLRPTLIARAEDPGRDESARIADLRVLAEVGTVGELELALRASTAQSIGAIEIELQRSVAAIVARDPAARGHAVRVAMNAPVAPATAIVRAISASGPEAQADLAELLGRTAELDLAVLSALVGNLRAEGPGADHRSVASAVRPFLASGDLQLAREAAAAAGELGDAEALPALVELLEAAVGPASESAHGALVAITGLTWNEDPARWRGWLETEQVWFEQRAASLFDDLGDTPAQRALAALGELGSHRYRRGRIGEEVVGALEHAAPEVRVAACATLERLGWPGATPALVDVLAHECTEVVAAAGHALRALTGLAHPDDDLEAWRALGRR